MRSDGAGEVSHMENPEFLARAGVDLENPDALSSMDRDERWGIRGDGYSPGSNAGAKELWRFHIVTGFIERFRVDPGGPRGPERSRAVPSGPERAAQRVERNRVHIQDTCEASLELAHSTARSHKHVAHRTRGRARGLRASEELGMRASHAPCCFTRLSIPAEHCGGRSRRSQVSPPPTKQVLVPVTT